MQELVRSGSTAQCLAASRDAKRVLVGTDVGVVVWDVASQKELGVLPPRNLRCVALSSDGARAATGAADLRFFDASSSRELRVLPGHSEGTVLAHVNALAFSTDGRRVLSGGTDATARIWDFETGEQLRKLVDPCERPLHISCVAFSPDEARVLTGGFDLCLHDASDGKLVWKQGLYTPKSTMIAGWIGFVDGAVVAAKHFKKDLVVVWFDATSGEVLHELPLKGHKSMIRSIAVTRDGRRALTVAVFTSGEPCVRLFDLASGKELPLLEKADGRKSGGGGAFSEDGLTAIAGCDASVCVWPLEAPDPAATPIATKPTGTKPVGEPAGKKPVGKKPVGKKPVGKKSMAKPAAKKPGARKSPGKD